MRLYRWGMCWTATIGIFILMLSGSAHAITIQLTAVGTTSGQFTEPLYVTQPPGDPLGRLFVVQHAGRIRIIDNTGTLLPTDFITMGSVGSNPLNLCTNASAPDERGCLGLAFHPNYFSNGKFYVFYTQAVGSAEVMSEFTVTNPLTSNVANTTFTNILGPLPDPESNHNGGNINFGPDGYLYIGIGDGGGGCDLHTGNGPNGNGQALNTVFGKMLRIDVDHTQPPTYTTYAIPLGNPFACSTGTEKKEIWAWGLRNPWRWSFDRYTGELYCGDVGQNVWEEIDIIVRGGNYGWRCYEATHDSSSSGCAGAAGCTGLPLIDPIHEYQHLNGNVSVTGGYVYRGSQYPALNNLYFFADYGSGRIWTLDGNCGTFPCTSTQRIVAPSSVSSFGQDNAGELYVCGLSAGTVYKISDSDPQPTPGTPSPTPTSSPAPTLCTTPTPTPSASPTASAAPSMSPSGTASPSPTPSSTPSGTAMPSSTPSVSATPTLNATRDWEVYQ